MTAIRQISAKTEKKFLFDIKLNWLERKRGILSETDVKDTIRVALPQQFGGSGDEWSPEHLFLGSISSCFMTTLFVFADKMQLEISHYECQTVGQIEVVNGKYEFTTINIYPKISIPDETFREKATQALEKAEKYCLISNSIKAKVICQGEIFKDKVLLHKNESEFTGL